ncbi:snRNA-activating protein complex subunit 2 [Oryzias melastigma]|uniref:snRNA-activating protein complex subunit 2 n=1 Tax=Oryzias melastigma TaxID=30732 RepID=A0A3B3B969_ORYME|nr:snRNA-activating protein complex subunit 2 [Oryzias melastigma]KAF6739159.1 snRNA-activating protein complex subunit 2 [Oryzias melastigma]
MKPPARIRSKPNRPIPTDGPGRLSCRWNKAEQRTLRDALEKLSKTAETDAEIDYSFLGKRLPKRSIAEIRSVLDNLKDKAITNAAVKLGKRRRDERAARKPIEDWALLASSLAGSLEETIETAFSQVLSVSSTEPCTLKNCDPPRDFKSPTSFGPPVRIVPVKPATHPPTRVSSKSPALSTGPSRTSSAITPKNAVCPAQKKPASGEAPPTSEIHTTPLPSEDNPSASPSPSALGHPSSSARSDSAAGKAQHPQRVMEVKQIVDFERIYNFLSVIQKPEEESRLTSMESAIVLDLLMSLPEELLLLDLKGLHNHMMKMYRCLTAPIDSLSATQLLSELKDGGCTPAAEQRGEASGGAAAGEDQPPSGSSSGQSQDSNKSKTVPPLNPFMVPLSLLVRQAESTNSEIHRGVRSSLF